MRINSTIKILIISDVFIYTGLGLITPILAIFIKEDLAGGSIVAAGVASFLFLVTKSFTQLPLSRYTDVHQNSQRVFLILGTLLMMIGILLLIPAKSVETIYVAEVILGIGSGLSYPTWISIWNTHLDKHHEGFEWSLYNTITSLGLAFSAAIGAGLVQLIGFQSTFAVMAVLNLIGGIVLLGLWHQREQNRQNS